MNKLHCHQINFTVINVSVRCLNMLPSWLYYVYLEALLTFHHFIVMHDKDNRKLQSSLVIIILVKNF